jgi:catechol 2,3-dioxygenase-like lactoylglutathione lyase family enzyme
MGGKAVTVILDHVGLKVTDFKRALGFYREALGTLGIQLLADFEVDGVWHAGFGIERPTFWIGSGKITRGDAHVALVAGSRSEVKAFYTVALSMGGRDNGQPGMRPHYLPNYFSAYVLDHDGYNIEAVYIGPDEGKP